MMGYAVGQPVLWPAPPEWSESVKETLAWLTDGMQASGTGMQQTRALRATPRRTFSFTTLDDADARRIVDAIAFDIGTRAFLLPIYTDIQVLGSPLDAGAEFIPCRTAGFDFVVGGQVVLWQDVQQWELATIADIEDAGLTLAAPTGHAWWTGTQLYPVRRARLQGAPQATQSSSDIASLDVSILIDEPCDWPAAWPSATTYRGLPVLEWRGDEANNPTAQYNRLGDSVDTDTAGVYYFDLPGLSFRVQSLEFLQHGRTSHTAFRSLLYALVGAAGEMWVPSWQDDLRLIAPVTATATQLQFAPCYYSVFGAQQTNRRDIRIELVDGTVFYRRIIGSAQLANSETLQLDSALGQPVSPDQVNQISWLSVCALAGDTVEIDHDTDADGVATATLQWQAVQNHV